MQSENSWERFLELSLTSLDQNQLRRRKCVTNYLSPTLIERNGQQLVNFGGNDYLGMRNNPKVIAAATTALQHQGVGSGASPAVTGYSHEQGQLEACLAKFNGSQAALVLSSGYACNLATISSLVSDGDVIFSDALNHASLIDGCRLTKAAREIYPHNDVQQLRERLLNTRHHFKRALIVTESIFSMDGDAAPLADLADLAEQFDCGLIVDEAHATGVYGPSGAGLVEELGLSDRVLGKLGTLSKAIGCLGGYLCGSQSLVEHVLNFGRAYMFSTALPSSLLAAAKTSVELIESLTKERSDLRQRSKEVRINLRRSGWQVLGDDSPILPIVLGDERTALELSANLQSVGLFVPAIRPPTVPIGTSRLRISLSCEHTEEQVERLFAAFSNEHLRDC
ncbi:MAG: 8-amino-7-oxononanoate synthase [Pirellulaceae bacterium]|nr:8-amino-7-oxononanoate synthase [Pirellulaceae bacterium]